LLLSCFFFFQAEDGIRDSSVTGVQTCALPISLNQGEFAISPTGILSTKQGTVGQLRVVSFERPQFLQSIGGTLFSSGDSPFEIKIGRASCRKGFRCLWSAEYLNKE